MAAAGKSRGQNGTSGLVYARQVTKRQTFKNSDEDPDPRQVPAVRSIAPRYPLPLQLPGESHHAGGHKPLDPPQRDNCQSVIICYPRQDLPQEPASATFLKLEPDAAQQPPEEPAGLID